MHHQTQTRFTSWMMKQTRLENGSFQPWSINTSFKFWSWLRKPWALSLSNRISDATGRISTPLSIKIRSTNALN
jgi:hypothetical protein